MDVLGAEDAGAARLSWREATERALYGEGGFYRRTSGPGAHFRTSVHASPLFAESLLTLIRSAALDTVVDVGAGRGELLAALHRIDPSLRLIGVEVADRPADLPAAVGWTNAVPAGVGGLLVANEWLDNVPLDVAVRTHEGVRLVLVDPATGQESIGRPVSARDVAWLERWWPLHRRGDRAEIGWPRDEAWTTAVTALGTGLAVAVDYGHRVADRPAGGSLTGYRTGRQVIPVPDGMCDITAHVAMDACAAAGLAGGASATVLTTQRDALGALGVTAARPSRELAVTDPGGYLAALSRVDQLGELRARGGLGDFCWLVQAFGTDLPAPLQDLPQKW